MLIILFYLSILTNCFGQSGVAPVNPPLGGFRIDGYIQRQTSAGDWLPGNSPLNEPGTFIYSNIGVPLFPRSVHIVDLWDTYNDNVISKGTFQTNPNAVKWGFKKAHSRTDIHNALFFVASNPVDNHTWIVVSGDRVGSNASSYIDIEFFQNPVLQTLDVISKNTSGGFVSYGPHNGRTIGDVIITVGFNGVFSTISFRQWGSTSPGEYGYLPLVPPAGAAYSSMNFSPINVPYGAFGSTTYPAFSFVEAAIDMTALFPGQCLNLANTFRTVWIKSRQKDGSSQDNLDDFVTPFQLPLSYDYTLDASYTFLDLYQAQLSTTVSPGTSSDFNFHWTALGSNDGTTINPLITGSLNDYNIPNPIFTADPNQSCLSYLYEVTVARKDNPACIVARTPIIINNPCKIGKPINPDRNKVSKEGINENRENAGQEIRIYPNPSRGSATVNFPDANDYKDIDLIDMTGNIVRRWRKLTANTLEFKNLQAGIYILKVVTSEGSVITKKIIVSN